MEQPLITSIRSHLHIAAITLLAAITWPAMLAAATDGDGDGVESNRSQRAGENETESNFVFIDNGKVRLGIKKTSGAAIAWFSPSDSKRNLVNHFDHGRLIQQSYYGDVDGSKWAQQPWRWNPVQGGDYKGHPARVLQLDVARNKLVARTQPVHWAAGNAITDMTMEQRITLSDHVAHVRFKMHYTGKATHKPRHQEVPAVFVTRDLGSLILYDGEQPWKGKPLRHLQPGGNNEYHDIAENWAAYVDKDQFGMGVYVPIAKQITSYRVAKPGDAGACSYFAPIVTFGIKPNMTFAYDVYLTAGTADQIRKRFETIAKQRAKP